MPNLRFVPYSHDLFEAYHIFAEESWGKHCYQSKRNYLEWLYRSNPCSKVEIDDFLVATASGNEILGAIHKMRFPWLIDSEVVDIPAAHNLYVNAQHRAGTGMYLVTAMVRGEKHMFCPGQLPPLTNAYRALKWQNIPVNWYRRILSPVSTGLRMAQLRMFPGGSGTSLTVSEILPSPEHIDDGIIATASSDDTLVSRLAAVMRSRLEPYRVKPHWTEALVHWRFFHPLGPRHILFYFGDDELPKDFLLVSVGMRHGFRTSRIIDASLSKPDRLALLIRKAEAFLARRGMHVLLAYSADSGIVSALRAAGWRQHTRHENETFFYHRNKMEQFSSYAFNASAGDFGFEAIP